MTQPGAGENGPTTDPFAIENWCSLPLAERREMLASALFGRLSDVEGVRSVTVEVGPVGREYDLTAAVETEVGRLRTTLWSHARAVIYCDPSIHPANRQQLGPSAAVEAAAERLRGRLAVPYRLESRGLTFQMVAEPGVRRIWTAEHARFRKRTAVTREDVVEKAGDVDVRDLLAHFYVGPSVRLVPEADGETFLLPEANDVEGELIVLCRNCERWSPGHHAVCPACGSPAVDEVIAARPPKR